MVALTTAIGTVKEHFVDFVLFIPRQFHKLIQKVKEVLGIHSPSSVFIDIGKDIIKGLVNGVKAAWHLATGVAKTVGEKVINGAKKALAGIKKLGGTIWAWLKDGVGTVAAKLLQIGGNIVSKLVAGFKFAREKVVALATWVYNRIRNGVSAIYEKFKSIGTSIIDGLVSGIKAAKDTVFGAIETVATGIVNTVKDVLDIASPSRVMEGLGEQTMAGFAKGITSGKSIRDHIIDQLVRRA